MNPRCGLIAVGLEIGAANQAPFYTSPPVCASCRLTISDSAGKLLSGVVGVTLAIVKTGHTFGAKESFIHLMVRLTRRQRHALVVLAVVNLIVLGGLVGLLLRAPSLNNDNALTSPINPQRLQACRRAASRALLDAGQTGLVHTREDGTILVQLQRTMTTDALRLDADGAAWAAFEAVADGGDCRGLRTVKVTVVFTSSAQSFTSSGGQCQGFRGGAEPNIGACERLHAMARVAVADLMMWALGEIDDAELARRVDYQPPATPSPVPTDAMAIP